MASNLFNDKELQMDDVGAQKKPAARLSGVG
jgi:hypothetical protein